MRTREEQIAELRDLIDAPNESPDETDSIQQAEDHIAEAERRAEQRVRAEIAQKGKKDITNGLSADIFWDYDDGDNCGGDIKTVMENYDPFEFVEMQTGFFGPNVYGYHDGSSSHAFATEEECKAAIDAARENAE